MAALKVTVCLLGDDEFVAAISLPEKYLSRSVQRALVAPVLKSCAAKRGAAPSGDDLEVLVAGAVVSQETIVEHVAWGSPAAATLRPKRAAAPDAAAATPRPKRAAAPDAAAAEDVASPYAWCQRVVRAHVFGAGGAEACAATLAAAFPRQPWYRPTATGKNESSRAVHLVIARTAAVVVAREVRDAKRARRLVDLAVALAVAGVAEYALPRRLADELPFAAAPTAPDPRAARALAIATTPLEALAARAAERLAIDGLFIAERGFLDAAAAAAVAREAAALDHARRFARAEVKDREVPYVDAARRGDLVWWLDGSDPKLPLLSALTQALRGLGAALGPALVRARPGADAAAERTRADAVARAQRRAPGAGSVIEDPAATLPHAMLSVYPGGGARFQAHVDNEGSDLRVLTAVYYLNDDWPDDGGGALRLYRPGGPRSAFLDVKPALDKLVIFWSRLVEHEVRPAFRDRWALSMWYSEPPAPMGRP